MKELKNIIIMIFAVIFGMGTTILVMIKRWGLKPQSWWWIIGVYIIGHIIAQIFVEIAKH